METMKRGSKRGKRGLVLPVIAAIAICLALLGLGVLRLGFGSRLMATRTMAGVTARAAADAGITRALFEINNHFIVGPGWDGTLPSDSVDLSNSTATCNYTTQHFSLAHPVTGEDYWLITSIGKLGTQQKTVYATLGVRNENDIGLRVTGTIDLKSDTLTDGYDSSLGAYTEPPDYTNSHRNVKIGTSSIADNAIWLHQNTKVTGPLLVGIGGDVYEVIQETPQGGSITGPWLNMWELWPDDPIIIPDCGGNLGDLSDLTVPIGQIGQVTYRKYQNINIPTGAILNILGTVYIHVTGDLTIHNGAELHINGFPQDPLSWSSVQIYLNGDLTVNNGGLINNSTEKPRNFRLFGIGTSIEGENWWIYNSGNYFGVYHGENANIRTFATAEFYGAISGRNFILFNGGRIHYDQDLANEIESDIGFGIDRMWEKSDFVVATGP